MTGWTKEETDYLKENYLSPTETAKTIGKYLGKTRRAVIGRWYRLNRDNPNAEPVVIVNPAMADKPEPIPEPKPTGKGLLDLKNNECHAIIGDKIYCGDKIKKHSYCAHHFGLYYKKEIKRAFTPKIEYKNWKK